MIELSLFGESMEVGPLHVHQSTSEKNGIDIRDDDQDNRSLRGRHFKSWLNVENFDYGGRGR